MIKKLNVSTLAVGSIILLTSLSFAAPAKKAGSQKFQREYGMAGCGLGSLAMGRSGGQISASTTNATGGQFYAITSGTSNCIDSATEEVAHRMDRFIQVNQVALANDMARGNGEALAALASIVGCSDSEVFSTVMQKSFRDIYPNEKVRIMDVTDSVIDAILKDQKLKTSCAKLA